MAKRPSLAEKMRAVAAPTAPPETPKATGASPIAPEPQPAQKRTVPASGFYAATRAGKKKVTATLDPAAHKQLKQLGLDRDITTEALLVEAINDLFTKHGKLPIA